MYLWQIWAIAGGEIIFSSDPRNMTAFQKKVWMNTEILAVYNDTSGFRDIKEYDDTTAIMTDPTATTNLDVATCSLTKKLSRSDCTLGKSFGCFENKTMWTNNGCRGMFTCEGVENVPCDQMGGGTAVCKCVTGPIPPTPPGGGGKSHDSTPQVWMRPTADGGAAIVLHNPSDTQTAAITVDFTKVPKRSWTASRALSVRDLWAHASLGSATGKFTSKPIAPHSSMFLKLTK
jgi:hypothetical protein